MFVEGCVMERKDHWRVQCDLSGDSPRYVVFRNTEWDGRKRRFKDIEFAPEQPIEGFDKELEAWGLVNRLNEQIK